MKKFAIVLGLVLVSSIFGLAFAQEAESAKTIGDGLIALGAAVAIGVAAIGVGLAQAAIGSAGAGTLAERPEAFGQILIYLVIPETIIIFAFVIAFFLNGQIG